MSVDSQFSSYRYVRVDEFNPNSPQGWTAFGNVTQCLYDKGDAVFTLTGTLPQGGMQPAGAPLPAAPTLKIYILGPTAFRVRFNPQGDYSMDGSFAVVNKELGAPNVNVLQNDAVKLSVDLGGIRLDVLFHPFTVQVFLHGQLISTDTAQGLIYVSGGAGEAIANFKAYPANANYFGAGEKGGSDLALNDAALTFFNYDNFKYSGANGGPDPVVPSSFAPGPLDWTEPLYNSIPFFIEDNPNPLTPGGLPTGVPYSYGILFDNESQSYFNFGASSPFNGNMYGKYFFGALYGEMDYYFLAGDTTQDVLQQYSTLTGPAALAPHVGAWLSPGLLWLLQPGQGCGSHPVLPQCCDSHRWDAYRCRLPGQLPHLYGKSVEVSRRRSANLCRPRRHGRKGQHQHHRHRHHPAA